MSEALSGAVLATAKEMENMPAGRADFFAALKTAVESLIPTVGGKYSFDENSAEYQTAVRRYCQKETRRTGSSISGQGHLRTGNGFFLDHAICCTPGST